MPSVGRAGSLRGWWGLSAGREAESPGPWPLSGWCLLAIFPAGCFQVQISPSHKDTRHLGLQPALVIPRKHIMSVSKHRFRGQDFITCFMVT